MNLLRSLASPTTAVILGAFALAASAPAHADPVAWTNWSSATSGNPGSASGTMGSATVTYSGQTSGLGIAYSVIKGSLYPGVDAPTWFPSSYTGGNVGNAPPTSYDSVALEGGSDLVETITFSTPVVDPLVAIWSLGASGISADFDFTSSEPFSIIAGGVDEYGGASIYQGTSGNADNVYGEEGSGVVEFIGTYSSLTFTTPSYENWYGFTVGEDTVLNDPTDPLDAAVVTPEPETLSLFCLGLSLAALPVLRNSMARRRLAHKAIRAI
jgi:hypothetical protein